MEISRTAGAGCVLIRTTHYNETTLLLNMLSRLMALPMPDIADPARDMHDELMHVVRERKETVTFKMRPDGAHRDF